MFMERKCQVKLPTKILSSTMQFKFYKKVFWYFGVET